jgi:hypothetical protein
MEHLDIYKISFYKKATHLCAVETYYPRMYQTFPKAFEYAEKHAKEESYEAFEIFAYPVDDYSYYMGWG